MGSLGTSRRKSAFVFTLTSLILSVGLTAQSASAAGIKGLSSDQLKNFRIDQHLDLTDARKAENKNAPTRDKMKRVDLAKSGCLEKAALKRAKQISHLFKHPTV